MFLRMRFVLTTVCGCVTQVLDVRKILIKPLAYGAECGHINQRADRRAFAKLN